MFYVLPLGMILHRDLYGILVHGRAPYGTRVHDRVPGGKLALYGKQVHGRVYHGTLAQGRWLDGRVHVSDLEDSLGIIT